MFSSSLFTLELYHLGNIASGFCDTDTVLPDMKVIFPLVLIQL